MFVLVVVAVIIVMGIFLIRGISNFYNDDFTSQMQSVFTQNFISDLESGLSQNSDPEYIVSVIKAYSGAIGLDSYRHFFVLNGKTAEYVAGDSPEDLGEKLEKSYNIIKAMSYNVGADTYSGSDYMDYAVKINAADGNSYIIYIKDSMDDMRREMNNIFDIILKTLIFTIVISIIMGFFLSQTITKPIIDLTKHTQLIAEGRFDNMPSIKTNDEIGILSDNFGYMAKTLSATMAQIENEKAKMDTIFDNMTDGLLAFDSDGQLMHINTETKHLLNVQEKDVSDFDTYFKSVNAEITLGDFLYLQQTNPIERMLNINDNYIKFTFARFSFSKDENNETTDGIVVVLHDITKQEKLETSRKEFVANVSHELRTPLTTIKSYAETLRSMPDLDSEMSDKFLSVIDTEADRMTRIVKDLLTLSRLDHGKAEFKSESVDIDELARGVTEKLKFEAQSHKHTLSYKTSGNIPIITADRDKIEQVVINLVSNSIKYTPDGGRIDVSTDTIHNDVMVRVTDNGVGIPKEHLQHIFDRFYRVDKARTRSTGGTGLGLAIAKEIIDAHKGTITINSDTDKGCEVIIRLPVNV